MGPLEEQMRAQHLAAKERLWRNASPVACTAVPNHITAAVSALRRELAHLRSLLQAKGLLEEAEMAVPGRITCGLVRAVVAAFYRIPLAEIDAKGRPSHVIVPRQAAMYLCKTLTWGSFPEIGRRFGGRDHTTVVHAVRKIEKLRQSDRELDDELRELQRRIAWLARRASAS